MFRARRVHALLWLLVSTWVLSAVVPAVAAAAPSEERRKREELRRKLGLPPGQEPAPPQTPPEPDEEPDAEPDEGPDEAPDDARTPPGSDPDDAGPRPDGDGGRSSAAKVPTYAGRIDRLLQRGCASCHKAGGSAGGTRLLLSGDASTDYAHARKLVDRGAPRKSLLLTKGAGQSHGGGAPFPEGSAEYRTILAWIEGGAPRGGSAGASTVTPVVTPPVTPPPEAAPSSPGGPRRGVSPTVPRSEPPSSAAPPPDEATTSEASEPEPGPDPFASIHATLQGSCAACHAPGKIAGAGGFVLTGELEADRARVLAHLDLADPAASPLLTKAAGQQHGGGAPMPVGSNEYRHVLSWIAAGAPGPNADQPPQAPALDAMTGASPPPETRLGDGTPLPEATHPSNLPFGLPANLRINGRIDFSYERRDVKDHPFSKGGRNAFATYHHFLFLSRSGAKDPFGFNVELITQQFYEFNARWRAKRADVQLMWKAGKILVPFGDEPLFHTSYGGRTGFDQELLPVVWSQPGIAFNVQGRVGPVTIGNDIYAIQGLGLANADAVLNLQNDLSPLDDVKIATGDRVGISVLPFTAWYSFQFTPLGFGRLLFMQALDAEFWRWPGVPFVENLVVGLGAMRADVSRGDVGGRGGDYYHFGSYAYARYYFIPQLSLQYRAGLKTFDNRRGLFFDDTRVDERDRGSHNVTITGRYRGFYAALQFFWNLERANEQDDDFFRLTVGYEF